jgi:hypothetical protein
MSRESRLLVILLVIGGVGVSGLMVVANQYRKALATHAGPGSAGFEDAPAHAARLVDGFLAARQAAKAVVAHYPLEIKQLTTEAILAYRTERSKAFTAHRMTYEEYAAVRAAWRAYRDGKAVSDPALRAALQGRKSALDEASLGPIEVVDDAIK